jgi:nicotinamidase-related amidase
VGNFPETLLTRKTAVASALIVIDVQRGMVNDNNQHVVPKVIELIRQAMATPIPVLFTRFINHAHSGHVKWMAWSRFMDSPEVDLHPEILPFVEAVFDKPGYTSLIPPVRAWLHERGITRVYCCGVDTECCVLKTAVDAFELDIEPIVVHDACASHAGPAAHEAGLFLLSRFIGKNQIRGLNEVVGSQFT